MGKFYKGQPKHPLSGRKKGTKNKKELLGVEDFFASKGLHPLEMLLHYVSKIENPADAAKIMAQVMRYWAPVPATPKGEGAPKESSDTTDKPDVNELSTKERLELIRGSGGINRPTG